MRRSHRPSSTASSHNLTANFFSENSNSSHSATSEDSNGQGSPGPELGESEGRMSRGSSCGEPALSPGVLRGNTRAPRSHNGQTALCAATVRGGASGTGGVEPGGERAGRAGSGAEPTRRLRGSCSTRVSLRGELSALAGPGRGWRKSCAWAWLRRCLRARVSGSLDPGPPRPGLRLGWFLPTETLQLRVWECAGSVPWGCGRTQGLFEGLPSCLA